MTTQNDVEKRKRLAEEIVCNLRKGELKSIRWLQGQLDLDGNYHAVQPILEHLRGHYCGREGGMDKRIYLTLKNQIYMDDADQFEELNEQQLPTERIDGLDDPVLLAKLAPVLPLELVRGFALNTGLQAPLFEHIRALYWKG